MSTLPLFRTSSVIKISQRGLADLFVGAHAKLVKEEEHRKVLHGIKVAVLHKDLNALLIAKILADDGAEIHHYVIKGRSHPKLEKSRELDLSCQGKIYLENVLRKSDVFVNGLGEKELHQYGIEKYEIAKKNGQLIVAECTESSPFAAMTTAKGIAIGLLKRNIETKGHAIDTIDSSVYKKELEKYLHSQKHNI